MILGAKKDPTFGTVIMAGMGGIAAEVFRDRALGLPPPERALGLPDAGIATVLEAPPGVPGAAGGGPEQTDRSLDALLLFYL